MQRPQSRFSLSLFSIIFFLVSLCSHGKLYAADPPLANSLIIRNVTIISPERDRSQANMTVLIEGGRISRIFKAKPSDYLSHNTIDGTGLFLTPGLMDSHVHITHVPGFDYANSPLEEKHKELIDAHHRQQPRSFLYHGVTQVLDPGPKPRWERFTDQPLHPDLFRCGVLPNLGSYPLLPIKQAITNFPNFVMDPTTGYNMIEGLEADPKEHTPERALKAIKKSGAICVKLFIEDGFGLANHWAIPGDDILKKIKRAAQTNDIILYAHANAIDMMQIALRNQVDVIGHGLWNWQWPQYKKGPPPLQETLDSIKSDERGYIPTFGVIDGLRRLTSPNPLNDPRVKNVTPKSLLNWYQTNDAQWFKQDLIADFGPNATAPRVHAAFNAMIDRAKRALAYLNDIKHDVALGSDYPGSPSYAKQPGLSTLQEMEMMAEAGLSLQKIFEAATINNARLFGIEDDYGSVEVGKKANLLLLKENPLITLKAWDMIDTVILHGKPIKRGELRVRN